MRVKKGTFHEQSVSRFCGKKHSFHERHSALSILSATKDEEGERWHLINGDLRRKNLRQWRASRMSVMLERTHLLGLGTSGRWLRVPIATAHLPRPFSFTFSCIFVRVEGEKDRLVSFSPFITFILFYFQVLVLFFE